VQGKREKEKKEWTFCYPLHQRKNETPERKWRKRKRAGAHARERSVKRGQPLDASNRKTGGGEGKKEGRKKLVQLSYVHREERTGSRKEKIAAAALLPFATVEASEKKKGGEKKGVYLYLCSDRSRGEAELLRGKEEGKKRKGRKAPAYFSSMAPRRGKKRKGRGE